MAATTQRLRIGASDVVYAVLNESSDIAGGTATWGSPVSLPNVKSIGYDAGASIFTGFYDDKAGFSADAQGVQTLTVNFADVSPENRAALLGQTYANGETSQNFTDVSPYVALGFKTLRTGTFGGLKVYDYFWFFKGLCKKPSIDAQTKAESISPADVVLEFNFVGLNSSAGVYMKHARTDDDALPAATLSGFFTAVALASANLNALTVTAAEGTVGNAGKILFTFAKTGGASFSINASTISTVTCPVYVAGALKAGTYAVAAAGTTVVVTFTPTVAFTSAQVATAIVTAGAKDNSGIGATPYSVAITIA
jgi:phi13 family phage major tail protein